MPVTFCKKSNTPSQSTFAHHSIDWYNTLMQPGQTINPGPASTKTEAQLPTASTDAHKTSDGVEADKVVDNKFDSDIKDSNDHKSKANRSSDDIAWTASEFIAHTKNPSWYLILAIATLILTAIIYLLTKDKVTAVAIVIASLLFGIMASRKPRELEYSVGTDGMHIGPKFYPYSVFKSFSVMQEEGIESIWFMPLKRFMPGLSIYFAPDQGQKIIDVLSEYLPFENRKLDMIDGLMHRLRF